MAAAPNRSVLCIVGPTCSGKTALSIAIARRVPCEIVSADSRQVFRTLDIGTAKPTRDILQEIPHHFIDIVEPGEAYSAGRFAREAALVIDRIIERGRMPLVVGGSGLYLRALFGGLHDAPGAFPEIRYALQRRMESEGVDAMLAELARVDPSTAGRMQMKHRRRIVRALEVYHATGTPLSVWELRTTDSRFTARTIGLRWERSALYARIDARVDAMMRDGLMAEVVALRDRGYDDSLQSLNTPGYKELFAYLRGECSLERAVNLIKQHTRNYAKRQITWFGKDGTIEWVECGEGTDVEEVGRLLRVEG